MRIKEELRMKYSETKVKGISKKELEALEKIAMNASYSLEMRGGIEGRDNDAEDFPEVSVNAILAMLEKAFLLGKEKASK